MAIFKLTVILLCMSLAGCASVGEIVSKPAYATFTGAKQPEALAQCIRDTWQNTHFRGATLTDALQRSGHIFRVVESGSAPVAIAVINGDAVSVHFATIGEAFKRNRVDALKTCL